VKAPPIRVSVHYVARSGIVVGALGEVARAEIVGARLEDVTRDIANAITKTLQETGAIGVYLCVQQQAVFDEAAATPVEGAPI
jgi:hypothetical protein